MWHKLREIFGYKDSRRVQNEVLNTEIQEITIGNDTIQESDMENNENHVSNNVKSNMERIDKSSLMKYKEKWEADECFECQVTASLVTFGMVAHICYSLWQKRVQLPPNKVKYIVMANASLFGSKY